MNKPMFITFTGADDNTDIQHMIHLSTRYPIEWGILFSATRLGSPRYPSWNWIHRLLSLHKHNLRISAHLCGIWADTLIKEYQLPDLDPILKHFDRVQVNTTKMVNTARLKNWAAEIMVHPIIQWRNEVQFTNNNDAMLLFDKSGGKGITPTSWPARKDASVVGYAGNLGPDNVAECLQLMDTGAGHYWIDMETKLRNSQDQFDLDICEEVCRKVYPFNEDNQLLTSMRT